MLRVINLEIDGGTLVDTAIVGRGYVELVGLILIVTCLDGVRIVAKVRLGDSLEIEVKVALEEIVVTIAIWVVDPVILSEPAAAPSLSPPLATYLGQ